MEFDIRKAALTAATLTESAASREDSGTRFPPPMSERILATAETYAKWLREGVQKDDEAFRSALEASECFEELPSPETAVQRVTLRGPDRPEDMTPEEVWGTERCGGCDHLTSVHTLDGECMASPSCNCVTDTRVTDTAPDTDATAAGADETAPGSDA